MYKYNVVVAFRLVTVIDYSSHSEHSKIETELLISRYIYGNNDENFIIKLYIF